MCDEPEHKSLLETVGDEICKCLPERLRNDEKFVYHFGQLLGFAAGWIVGKNHRTVFRKRRQRMKGVVFIIALIVILAIFGVPVLGCFMGILVIGLGVGVEAAMPLAMILTVAMVAGIGIKSFFIDE